MKRLREPIIVELVGPAGSGKSTLLHHVQREYAGSFSYIGTPQPNLLQKMLALAETELCFFEYRNLPPRQRKSTRNGAVGMGSKSRWLTAQQQGVILLDEGPVRIMLDYASHSSRQLDLWRKLCKRRFLKLADLRLLVIRVEALPEQRFDRRRQRMSRIERESPEFNPAAKPRPSRELLFLREEILQWLGSEGAPHAEVVSIENKTDIDAAAASLMGEVMAFCERHNAATAIR